MKCSRCGGLMVLEEFTDFLDERLCFQGYRCLLCGEIDDQVIRDNRRARPLVKRMSPPRIRRYMVGGR